MYQLKVRKIGSSLGVIIPAEMLKDLGAREGDTLLVTGDAKAFTLRAPSLTTKMALPHIENTINRFRGAIKAMAENPVYHAPEAGVKHGPR